MAFLFLLFFGTSPVWSATEHVLLPAPLKEVEAHYAKAATVIADFEQSTQSALSAKKKESSGRILIKRPDKVRWETLKPDTHLMVSDGQRFWFYTPPFEAGERGQVIIRKTAEVQSKLATALLVGSFSSVRDMRIETKDAHHFLMIPKRGTSGTVQDAEIEISAQKEIRKITVRHVGGNVAEIRLTKLEMGSAIRDELFVFITPPKTDTIKE